VTLVGDPLRERREALVEPDVGPDGRRHVVTEPLVGDLVDDGRGIRRPVVLHPRLRLQRVADLGRVIDDDAAARERIRAVELREEVDDRRLRGQAVDGALGDLLGIDRVVERQAAGPARPQLNTPLVAVAR
jgi:hypothetical protein